MAVIAESARSRQTVGLHTAGEAIMDPDDLLPNKPSKPKDLNGLSISDLNDYIALLESEIDRARQAIQSKQASRAGADAWFKR
jgi:uncharacterized small protein (DUF1192 family)